MQQTFIKTIDGHSLQFNRLLYPVRYNILNQGSLSNGRIYTFEKNDNGKWSLANKNNLPEWVEEIQLEVHFAIENNENSLLEETYSYSSTELRAQIV